MRTLQLTFLSCFSNTVWYDQCPDIPKRPEFVLLETETLILPCKTCLPCVREGCDPSSSDRAYTELGLPSCPSWGPELLWIQTNCFLYSRITPCHKSRHCPSEPKAQELEWDFGTLPVTLWGRSQVPSQSYVTEEPEVQTLSPGGFDQARLCRYVFGD